MLPITPLQLFVRDTGTCRPSQWNHFGSAEARLPTPTEEIGGRKVEGIAELDQHI
jgi:hypothetical protein